MEKAHKRKPTSHCTGARTRKMYLGLSAEDSDMAVNAHGGRRVADGREEVLIYLAHAWIVVASLLSVDSMQGLCREALPQ
ncbi:hypothetical protein FKP32DRAFT_415048 [Trametes sanguinea]|nr:hypothetical protein FKP32DRAFT_415048 [Trametes sanguinea]